MTFERTQPDDRRESASYNLESRAENEQGQRHREVGKAFSGRLHGFAEVAAPQIGHGAQAIVDTGVAWLVNRDCQGLSLAFGISVRR